MHYSWSGIVLFENEHGLFVKYRVQSLGQPLKKFFLSITYTLKTYTLRKKGNVSKTKIRTKNKCDRKTVAIILDVIPVISIIALRSSHCGAVS